VPVDARERPLLGPLIHGRLPEVLLYVGRRSAVSTEGSVTAFLMRAAHSST
jgi:hypothetical protein